MKKTLLLSLIVLASCGKKELPSNIESALSNYEAQNTLKSEFDKVINGLDEREINQLSIDSLGSIIDKQNVFNQILDVEERELREALRKNPEFSNSDEVKNRKKHTSTVEFFKKYNLILKRYTSMKGESL